MSITSSRQRLISHLKKRDPKLTDDDASQVVSSLKRFVILVQKLYTQPQAELLYKDRKVDGKKIRVLTINTNIDELAKVTNGPTPIQVAMNKLMKAVTKGKR